MAAEEVTIKRWTCDGCDKVQYGDLGADGEVYGISGRVVEHDRSGGGNGGEWFACRRDCIKDAVLNVLDQPY